MKKVTVGSEMFRAISVACLAAIAFATSAHAGNEANSVLYSHHTESAGELEINIFNDYSRGVRGSAAYQAQLFELEYAFTSKWTSALYLEGAKTAGEDYAFGGFRWENRYRLFEYGAFLNPVLYVEYEHMRPQSRFKLTVLGRKDTPEAPGPEKTEHAVETKLILGQDYGRDFDVAFNWINETNLDTGHWEFGYAAGLNYTIWRAPTKATAAGGMDLRRLKIGAEMFGGLGDNTLGLTLNPHVTEQYAGLNLYAGFANGMQMKIGGAAGLTSQSEKAIVRMMVGFEIK